MLFRSHVDVARRATVAVPLELHAQMGKLQVDPHDAEADITIDSGNGPPEATATRAIAALALCPRALLPPEETCER